MRRPHRSGLPQRGGIETLGLIGDTFKLESAFWDAIGALNDNFGVLGYVITGVFAASWILSAAIYHARGYDNLDVRTEAQALPKKQNGPRRTMAERGPGSPFAKPSGMLQMIFGDFDAWPSRLHRRVLASDV